MRRDGRLPTAQVSFTAGELAPTLKARTDTAVYYLACETLKNVLVRPQGSARVRPGLRNIALVGDHPTLAACRILPFVFNDQQRYAVVLGHRFINVFSSPEHVLVADIASPFDADQVGTVDFMQIANTMLLVIEHHAVQQLVRLGDGSFSLSEYIFERPPQHRYGDRDITLTPSATSGSVTVTANGTGVLPVYRAAGVVANVGGLAATVNVPCPAGVVAGDLLVAQIHIRNSPGDGAATTAASGWNAFAGNPYGSNSSRQALFWKLALGTESGTTVAFAATGTDTKARAQGQMYRFTSELGFNASPIVDDVGRSGTASPMLAPTRITPTGRNQLAVCMCSVAGAVSDLGQPLTGAAGGTWAPRVQSKLSDSDSGVTIQMQTSNQTGGNAIVGGSRAFTSTPGSNWTTVGFCLLPAAAVAAFDDPRDLGTTWAMGGVGFTITAIASASSATATLLGTLGSTSATTDWTEQAGSVKRGHYRSIAYYQDRLWLGGAYSAATQIWGSRVAAPYDFLTGGTNDSDPLKLPVSSGKIDPILFLQAGSGGLEVYTEGAEGVIPGGIDNPITPKSLAYMPQSEFGCRRVRPVRLNSATVFAQSAGGAIREMNYSDTQRAYEATPLSVRAGHLTVDPVRLAAFAGGFDQQSDFLLALNSDGTVGVMTSERSQEVAAWTQFASVWAIADLATVGNRAYAIARNGDKAWLQWFDFDAWFDGAAFTQFEELSTTVTGLTHFASTTVQAWADENWLTDLAVDVNGTVTLPYGVLAIEIGLPIDFSIRPMPANEAQGTPLLGRLLRPFRATVRYLSSRGIRINGRPIYDRPFNNVINTPPQASSNVSRVTLVGWSDGNSCPVEITREGPWPVEILALAVDYKVGGS